MDVRSLIWEAYLGEVVLEDVSDDARLVEVTPAALRPKVLLCPCVCIYMYSGLEAGIRYPTSDRLVE
jgi:hypothetical protein